MNTNEAPIKDAELNVYVGSFLRRHKNAVYAFCKRNNINIRNIHCTWKENMTVEYDYNGKVFFMAKLVPTEKSKHKFRTYKKFYSIS
jgi:hypothetical protein